jgi:hypothetical protein
MNPANSTLRPALWIPGLVYVDFRGGRPHLLIGPDDVEVPLYGRARRVHRPQAVLGEDPGLQLAARHDWAVDDVEFWFPPAIPRARPTIPHPTDRPQQWVVRPGPAALVVIVILALALFLARG